MRATPLQESLLNTITALWPNRAKDSFLYSLDVIGRPYERQGSVYASNVGAVGLSFDTKDDSMEIDYSITPLNCKRKRACHTPILIQSLVANAVILNAAFEVFRDQKFLGFCHSGSGNYIGFKNEDEITLVGNNGRGDICVKQGDNSLKFHQTICGFGVPLSSDLQDNAYESMYAYLSPAKDI